MPTVRAGIEISQGNPSRAIESLKAIPYEQGDVSDLEYGVLCARASVSASLSRRPSGSRVSEISRPPNLVANNPLFVLAYLGLARALALQGQTDKSRAAYQDFFTLWKDADPDIPILVAAKSVYANLK